jgi:hypothetical protein
VELLLITARWPLTSMSEFLEDEIVHLAKAFDRVTVAPLRPTSQRSAHVPAGIQVDTSLADQLTHLRSLSHLHLHSRATVALGRAIQPNPVLRPSAPSAASEKMPKHQVAQDLPAWSGRLLVGVHLGENRRPPSLVYTFWLTPQQRAARLARCSGRQSDPRRRPYLSNRVSHNSFP